MYILLSEGITDTLIGGGLVLLGTIAVPFINQIAQIYFKHHESKNNHKIYLKENAKDILEGMINIQATAEFLYLKCNNTSFAKITENDSEIPNRQIKYIETVIDEFHKIAGKSFLSAPWWFIKWNNKIISKSTEVLDFLKSHIVSQKSQINLNGINDLNIELHKLTTKYMIKSRRYFGIH